MAEKHFINVASGAPISVQIEISKAKARENSENICQRFLCWFKRSWYNMQLSFTAVSWWIRDHILAKNNSFSIDNIPKRSRDVAVLTGGTKGIGTEVLKKMLLADMHILMGCRNLLTADDVIMQLRADGITTGKVECIHLDLTSMASIREFANKILLRKIAINVLINNAEIVCAPFLLTMDGCESQFQVNYLGHFLLTMLLLPRMASSASENKYGRIINVSSYAMHLGQIDFTDLQMKKHYSESKAYCNSKFMQIVSSNYLDLRLQAQDIKIHSYSVHPGITATNPHMWWFPFVNCRFFVKTLEQCADVVTYTALSPDVEKQGGTFLWNCKVMKQRLEAYDPTVQQKLWQTSLELCSIDSLQISNAMRKATVTTMVEIG